MSTASKIPRLSQFRLLAPAFYKRGAVLLIVVFVLLLPLANPRVYATDEVQYYVYLRSLRFDGDLDFANDYQEFAERNPRSGVGESLLQPNRIREATGLYGNIAPVGSAIMWAPFFLLADILVHGANLFGAGIPADGFSTPYINAVCYGSALYGLLGLLLCFRLARRYASERAATLASITIWLATPLVFYMFIQMPFAHATGFFLASFFITLWHETRPANAGRTPRQWLALGLIGGLMTITREQLGLFLLFPALEALVGYGAALRSARPFATLGKLFGQYLLFGAVFVAALIPQIAVYQILNGEPRPAGEVSGRINWCSPHFIDTLVDYDPRPSAWCHTVGDFTANYPPFSRGAFVWSPVLVPALLGLVLLWRRDRLLAVAMALVFLGQTYIHGAYGTTWHLRGAFGFRRLIECTPIFIVGLALLLDWGAVRAGWKLLLVPAVLLIAWNGGLVLNATVFNAETNLRQAITWPDLWRWQLEAPLKAAARAGEILFQRCRFMENGRC